MLTGSHVQSIKPVTFFGLTVEGHVNDWKPILGQYLERHSIPASARKFIKMIGGHA